MISEANTGDDPADGWFPESVAERYDAPGGANVPEVVTPAVDVLEDLAEGPVLEFAIGAGRIAAPVVIWGSRASSLVSGVEAVQPRKARRRSDGGRTASIRGSGAAKIGRKGATSWSERMPSGDGTCCGVV